MRTALFVAVLSLTASAFAGCGLVGSVPQSDVCKKWMECQKAVNAKTGAATDTSAVHGPDGTCWNDAITAETCDKGCQDGINAANANTATKDLPECQ